MIYHTKMEKLKILFFKETLRHWHFKDVIKESGLSRERVNYYLKRLQKEKFITKIKKEKKMPYYIANKTSHFRLQKRLYGLNLLENLFNHITLCKGIKTAILFGSFARGDWGKNSDIDLFIYGDYSDFQLGKFEQKLQREIQIFSNVKKMNSTVIPNIMKGFHITESIEPFEVKIHA